MFEIIVIVNRNTTFHLLPKPPNDHQKWLEIAKFQCSKFHEINVCHLFYSHLHFGMPQSPYFLMILLEIDHCAESRTEASKDCFLIPLCHIVVKESI